MTDQIRTKCGRKVKKKGCVPKLNFITIALEGTYRRRILSAFAYKSYFEQFFDGVSFRDFDFSGFDVLQLLLAYRLFQISAGQKSSQGKYPVSLNYNNFWPELDSSEPYCPSASILLGCSPVPRVFISSKLFPSLNIRRRDYGKDV